MVNNNKFIFYKSNIFYYFLLSIVPLQFFINGLYAYGDDSIFIDIFRYLEKSSGFHENFTSLGDSRINSSIGLYPLILFGNLFKFFDYNNLYFQIVYIFFSFFLSFLSIHFLLKYKFKLSNIVCFIGSFFYTYNIFYSIHFFTIQFVFLKIFIPLVIFYYLEYSTSNKLKDLSKYLFFLFILSPAFLNPSVFSAFIFTSFLIFLIILIKKFLSNESIKIFIFQNFKILILFILMNFYWLYSFFVDIGHYNTIYSTSYKVFNSSHLSDSIRLLKPWAWVALKDSAQGIFLNSIFIKLIGTIVFLITIYYFILPKQKSPRIKFFTVILGPLFFIYMFILKGNGVPFGYLYEKVIFLDYYLSVFREPYTKFGPYLIFMFTLFLSFSLNEINKNIINFTVIILLLIQGFIIFSNNFIYQKPNDNVYSQHYFSHKTWTFKMPNYWKNASDFLNSNLINTSVVIFPEKTGFYDWDKGLIMSHPEKILFKRYALTMIQDEYLNQEEHILHKKMIHQFSNLEKIMNENGYGLLLYEDDVMPVSRNFKEQEIYKNFFNFIEKGNFELIFSEGKIKIYKINDKNFKFNLNVL